MELTRNFTRLDRNDAAIAGGKGASLGEMIQADIPVPPGFVILSVAFEQFIKETDLIQEIDAILESVNHKEIHTVEAASEKIKGLILAAKMPEDIATDIRKNFKELDTKYVAVRSSATAEDGQDHAWAGQLESYLNTTEADFLDKVKHCWASLFTPRAIFYRFEKGLHTTKISVAVVVQKMIESEVSGIAFSVHPVTEDRNQLIIEAGFGLGEAVVSGTITPDSYVVEKEPRRIIDINISTQVKALVKSPKGGNQWITIPEPQASSQVLNDMQVLKLSEIILGIEKHYGFPCDIEWAYESGKFYITQSRPITTLQKGDSTQKSLLDSSNLIRLFQFNGHVPYLYSDRFVLGYKDLEGVAMGDQSFWISYMTKSAEKKAMKEGLELFSDEKKYDKLKEDIQQSFNKTVQLKEKILTSKLVNKEAVSSFFDSATKYGIHYRYTEFFYTDLAFEKKDQNPVIQKNFQSFEELKIDGRKKLNEIFFVPNCIFETVLKKVSDSLNISLEDLFQYSMKEVIDAFDNKKVDANIIDDRKKAYVIYSKNDEINDVVGSPAKNILTDLYEKTHLGKELKGQIASPGLAKGIAKVIKVNISAYGELSKVVDSMEKGQILIAETTEPAIIQACQKASAIVTNQGGMMSHAAIVSRELKIPCIVGTGTATEIIKDGDLVEVDANNGIVRVLDKSVGLIIENKSWQMGVTRNMSFWHQCLSALGHYHNSKNFGIDANQIQLSFTELSTHTTIFVRADNMALYTKAILDAVSTNKGISNLKTKYKENADRLFNSLEDCLNNLNKNTLEDFLEKYQIMCAGLFLTTIIGRAGGDNLAQLLKENGYKEDEIDETIGLITYPKEHTPLFDSTLALLEIGAKVQEDKLDKSKIETELNKWLENYGHIPVNFCDDPWTLKEAQEMLGNLLNKDCSEELKRYLKDHEEKIKRASQKIEEIRNEEITILSHAIAEGTYLNEFRKGVFSRVSLRYRPIFEKIASKFGSKNWRDCFYLTPEEMLGVLENKTIGVEKLKKEREKIASLINDSGEIYLLNKSETEKINEYIAHTRGQGKQTVANTEKITSLKGFSANKGIVKAKAKLILSSKDFHKLLPGEILVTTMTSVDFVPVMERAGAFVTNEGGITSHASIVAREMNKPCIIGTKIATQVIKDGDMVEVDANKGIINIL